MAESASKVIHVRNVPSEATEGAPNRIILVTIHNPLLSPHTRETRPPTALFSTAASAAPSRAAPRAVSRAASPFPRPPVLRGAGLQALVQYNNQASAAAAKTNLQGRNIYDGCCTLDIQFSNLSELQVHYNNERTRDYVNQLPDQPGKAPMMMGQPGMPQPGMGGLNAYGNPGMAAAAAAQMFGGNLPPGVTGTNDRCTLLISNIHHEVVDADKLFNLVSNYGNVVRIKFLHNKPDHALVQLADGLQAELAVTYLKPDHALVQLADGLQAELAVTYLKGAAVFGKRLEVNYSKYPSINPSADTKDYSTSNLNRFGRNAPKNYRHCCAPTRMLHCSNLPADASADMVVEHMAPHGPVLGSKVIDKDGKKQVLVLFETVEAATDALVAKHATPIVRVLGSKVIDKDGKKQVVVLFETVEAATDALVVKHATPISGQVIRLDLSKSQNL
ncbi:unnamed protein product [Closterium sp. Naga37s-1]|nr:unnamed protein product [Closterium sp. Naga37s-1]